jgi:RAT1-interacting protein
LNEDLGKGFDEFVKFGEVDEHLDSLLASIQQYETTKEKTVHVDIITWRGMMTKIMTVYRVMSTLIVDAILTRGRVEYECGSI